ncbi:ABC transporter permease [Actinobaculum suis]|uniref:ABC transporter permease n=1 Tax=Actinobaculum suis TaxID=1657 RepID=UPI001E387202|nr:ABC transporter permease [Actinobaculum suis]
MTLREIKGKYKGTVLGQLWSLANPIALMIVYSFVFAIVIRVKVPVGDPSGINLFVIWLMAGLLPWTFMSNVVNGAMGAITGNENLIKKVYFPRSILVFSNSLAALYQHILELGILCVVVAFLGNNIWPRLPLIVVAVVLLTAFGTGLGMLFSIANVYFRDMQHFVGIFFQLWFYASPIVYPATYVLDLSMKHGPLFAGISVYDLYSLNPFKHFADIFRTMIYDGTWPNWGQFGGIAILSILVLLFGWWIFDRHQAHLAESL